MMYMMTADQHAQIVEALDAAENYMTSLRKPQVQAALFMVEAMRPVEPIACVYKGNQYMRHEFMDDKIPESSMPLYTTTKD